MAARIIAFVCLQFALFNTLNAQCLNRLMTGCGPNLLPMPLPITETILPNQISFNPNYGQSIMEVPYGIESIVSNPLSMPATTVIQDSSVANNLANALQLLVVSNLLSNTLPSAGGEVMMSGYGSPLDYGMMSPMSPCGYGSYNYIY